MSGAGPSLVTIGRVVRPFGRRGEVVVESLSDRPGRFEGLAEVWLGEGERARPARVQSSRRHLGRFVVKLAGVDSIDAAEGCRGEAVALPETSLGPLPAGSYYHHDLVGLEALDALTGRALGRVVAVLEAGAAPRVLRLRGEAEELLVPFAAPFVRAVDLEGRRLLVVPPVEEGAPPAGAGRP
jgi:16S rRNA processing protein RimM